jgi:hypothetical protein
VCSSDLGYIYRQLKLAGKVSKGFLKY